MFYQRRRSDQSLDINCKGKWLMSMEFISNSRSHTHMGYNHMIGKLELNVSRCMDIVLPYLCQFSSLLPYPDVWTCAINSLYTLQLETCWTLYTLLRFYHSRRIVDRFVETLSWKDNFIHWAKCIFIRVWSRDFF